MTSAPGGSLAGYLGLVALLYFPLPLLAQTQSAAPSAAEQALKKPTDFRSRVELRNEYQELSGNGYRNLIIPRLEYAVTGSVLFRIEVPYIWYEPGVSGGSGSSGIGDLLARGAWRAVQSEGFALVLATDVIFDTALDDRLGQGRTVLAPHVFAAIDVPKYNSTFFPNIQHYFSIGGDQNRADVSFTTLKANLLTRWPKSVYTFLEPQFTIDWERDSRVGLTIELEVGKLVSKNVAIWARPGIGVIHNDLPQVYNWNFEVGVRYIF
jgi:hypothetical protein